MARLAALGVATLTGLLLAGCYGGTFGQPGLSLPAADGVQTVSDVADALDGHRSSASESAKAAIGVTDALGSFVRDISADQRAMAALSHHAGRAGGALPIRQDVAELNGKRVFSGSALVMRTRGVGEYCESSTGYSVSGIPSLDETFGWESGAFTGGTRGIDARGFAKWSANASGAVVQGAIGGLSMARSGGHLSCPMNVPAFVLRGGESANAFSIPISLAFRHGDLSSLDVTGARFANGESLEVTSLQNHQSVEVDGVVSDGRTQVATFRADGFGAGTLTITSTGAQYVIADWIVVGT
jgi:hypothetical protein